MEASLVRKKSNVWRILFFAITLLVLLCGAVVGFAVFGNNAGNRVLTQNLSESVGDATAARFDLDMGTGNLMIDRLVGGEKLLFTGELQYLEGQDRPTGTVDINGQLYTLTLKASGYRRPGFLLPWSTCNGETSWLIHLNPTLPSDITVSSDGGNVKLNLASMIVTRLEADTGGGNMDVVLPDAASDMNVTAKSSGGNVSVVVGSELSGSNTIIATSGAGKVVVRLPGWIDARIHADTGMGKLTIDPQFIKMDDHTYQSPDYNDAADKIDITVESGAGNVNVVTK